MKTKSAKGNYAYDADVTRHNVSAYDVSDGGARQGGVGRSQYPQAAPQTQEDSRANDADGKLRDHSAIPAWAVALIVIIAVIILVAFVLVMY